MSSADVHEMLLLVRLPDGEMRKIVAFPKGKTHIPLLAIHTTSTCRRLLHHGIFVFKNEVMKKVLQVVAYVVLLLMLIISGIISGLNF